MIEQVGRRAFLQAVSLLPFVGNQKMNGISVDRDGTVIENVEVDGTINLNGHVGCVIRNVVVSSRNGADCIRSGANNDGTQNTLVENVTVNGSGGHGLVFTSGGGNIVRGLRASNCSHGLVFRCSNSIASDICAVDCANSGITIKGVQGAGNAMCNVVRGFNLFDADLVLEAHDDHIQSSNVVSDGVINKGRIIIKSVGTGESINSLVSNVVVDSSPYSGVEILRNVRLTILSGILVRRAGSYSFRTDTDGGAALIGCQSVLPRLEAISGIFSRADVI